jgi:hypothetical protein
MRKEKDNKNSRLTAAEDTENINEKIWSSY